MTQRHFGHALMFMAACGSAAGPPPSSPSAPDDPPEDRAAAGYRLELDYLLAIPWPPVSGPSSEEVPPAFAASHAFYEQAHHAYRARDYARSADGFVRAALILDVHTGIHAGTAAHNRQVLFENAAYAWLTAGAAETGRATLQRLRKEKRASADDLRRALEVLR
jgi:hypothetical protein